MITIVGKIFNWKNQGLKHKSKSSMFKSQSSKDKKSRVKHKSKSSMFKSQSSKDKKFKVFNAPWRCVRFK